MVGIEKYFEMQNNVNVYADQSPEIILFVVYFFNKSAPHTLGYD